MSLLEGSAVIAETEGTLSGRGRTADFLEYYRVATGSGQRRNFYQWRYGSISRYTPDYYRAGYIAMSGDNYRFRGLPGRKFAAGFSRNLDVISYHEACAVGVRQHDKPPRLFANGESWAWKASCRETSNGNDGFSI